MFYTNPLGALRRLRSVIDEGNPNTDWNPVWIVRTGRFEGGWTVEMAIPFKSHPLRLGRRTRCGASRCAARSAARTSGRYLTPVPQNLAGPQALNRVSARGTLVGLDLPPAGKNIELKPYGICRAHHRQAADAAAGRTTSTRDVGGDVKYGVTPNLTADLTVNTDFAQVEVDEQQVNLTRFSLFFPEKRDFFLEGRGIFDFARGGRPGAASAADRHQRQPPTLFYSRRIGLNRGRVIPIDRRRAPDRQGRQAAASAR